MSADSHPPKVALIAATLWGNRGAEAMLVTSIGEVRAAHPDAQFYVYSYLPQRDRELLNDRSIHIHGARPRDLLLYFPFAVLCWLIALTGGRWPDSMLPAAVRDLRRCTVLLDVSGIAFADGRVKFLPFNMLTMWPALLLRVPVVRLAQAMGPFQSPLNRVVSRLFLMRCRHLYARGEQTAAHLRELAVPPEKWSLSADIAFLYKPEYSLTDENPEQVAALEAKLTVLRESGKKVIGLSPSSVVYQKFIKQDRDYVVQFFKLIRALDPAYHYVLLPNATRQGSERLRNNDLAIIELIQMRAVRELPAGAAKRIHAVDFDLNTAASRRLIAACDVVVTSRFHGMISCLSLGVPVLVIGWSHKYAEVLAAFGLEDHAIDFAAADLDLPARFADLFAHQDEIREQITTRLAEVRALAGQQFEDVRALLAEKRRS